MSRNLLWIMLATLFWMACTPELPKEVQEAYAQLPDKVDYNIHVKPILSDKCFSCHGPDQAKLKAGLRLDNSSSAFGALPESPGKVAIDPGSPGGSELFYRIISNDPEYRMPERKSHLRLSAKEKATLIKWIEDGAEYKPHWAFVPPRKPDVPGVTTQDGTINPIDNFVLHALGQEKLQASPQAPKELLLRRLSLDLTGLPPTLAEIDAFVHDNSSDAYEKQVDRLLSSPHYGEKMAVDWLDLARFADSHGYTVDHIRDVSPYRDWVIQAFNQNLSYDQFVHWQLAGDLMPHPTKEMLIATAFNRLHQQNAEGGIIEEEFQTEYVIDRTNTLGVAFMGLQVGCARCHDHKFDPITHKNYYELFSFFNNVKEAGQISWDDAMPTPTMMLPSPSQEKIIQFLKNEIDQQEKKINTIRAQAEADFESWRRSKKYQLLVPEKIPAAGLQAYLTFDDVSLRNLANPMQPGAMKRELGSVPGDKPGFETHDRGMALSLKGDEWMDLGKTGVFRKADPFTISLHVRVPGEFKEGVIFHKCVAERLYNYRGYYLYLRDNKLEVCLAHSAPSNAITRVAKEEIPHGKWVQLTMTYDGSSTAAGLKLYQDGKEVELETTMDQLTKDILLDQKDQPGLQVGAWNRGFGLKGGMVDDLTVYDRKLTEFEISILAGQDSWSSFAGKSPDQLSERNKDALKEYFISAVHPGMLTAQNELRHKKNVLADSIERVSELMVMQEMPVPRKSFVLKRGNYGAFGEEVFPNTPESILPFPRDYARNRKGLALWLTHEQHPLTARVAVNRFWQNFFGRGLVKTSEDFGNQGELPSHPELLDWMAVTFRESGWDIKKMIRLIAMSATYRQDSKAGAAAKEKDPENRFLSHGPSVRLSAEMIRDNALAASGLMNLKIGGRSVKPYQPEGLWEINNTTYVPDRGDDMYRRSMYVLVKRSVPNPTLATFDASSRSNCMARRQETNTPLQALVTLNDPTFVEAARVMGEQISKASDQRKAIELAYRKLTGQTPNAHELDLLHQLQTVERRKFNDEPRKAKGWLTAGQYVVGKGIEPASVAANAVVASVILNSDACLTKR